MGRRESASRERVTELLTSWVERDARSEDRLSATLHEELRCLARYQLRRHPGGMTFNTTDVIHEAYLKLVDGSKPEAGVSAS